MPTVFFSWQSDTSNRNGRTFIEDALRAAIANISADLQVEKAVREGLDVDRDTKGVAGQPPIVDTIFKKIDKAAVFVPDLTFVGMRSRKDPPTPTPNPNVLIEYGWALKGLTYNRIVAVMNTAYGKPGGEAMPFDMRHLRRPICYDLPEDADSATKAKVAKKLTRVLEDALRGVFRSEEYLASLPKPPPPPAFPMAEAKSGRGRFRGFNEPLGFSDVHRHPLAPGAPEEIKLESGSCIWLRLMPSQGPGLAIPADELRRHIMPSGHIRLTPLYADYNLGIIRLGDGYGTFARRPTNSPMADSVAFAFKTGEIWSVDTSLIQQAEEHSDFRSGLPFLEGFFKTALKKIQCIDAEIWRGPAVSLDGGFGECKGGRNVLACSSRSRISLSWPARAPRHGLD